MKVRDRIYVEAVITKKIETDKGTHYEAMISQYTLVGLPNNPAVIIVIEGKGPNIKP